MTTLMVRSVALTATIFALSAAQAGAEDFRAKLIGVNETPSVLSEARGTLSLDLDRAAQTLKYTLTFSGLSAPVTQSHIHFGQARVAGGVIVFLCGTATNPGPAGTPTCPSPGGTVSGTITPANIIGPTAQGIAAGNFDGLEDALSSRSAYANVHSTMFPAGEIRGQIRSSDRDDE